MTKKFRCFFSLILVVFSAFFMVSCENKKDPKNEVIVQEEETMSSEQANTILTNSISAFETSLAKLNESQILKDNNYTSTYGLDTVIIFENLYSAYLFQRSVNVGKTIDIDKVYSYKVNKTNDYFKMYEQDDNKLFIDYVVKNTEGFTYLGYEIYFDDENVDKIDFTILHTSSENYVEFSKSYFNFKNDVFEIYSGYIVNSNDTDKQNNYKQYLTEKFTQENFNSVSYLTYTLYEKFSFGKTKDYVVEYVQNTASERFINNIESLNIVKAYSVFDGFSALSSGDIGLFLTNDIFGNIQSYGQKFGYNNSSCVFEKND